MKIILSVFLMLLTTIASASEVPLPPSEQEGRDPQPMFDIHGRPAQWKNRVKPGEILYDKDGRCVHPSCMEPPSEQDVRRLYAEKLEFLKAEISDNSRLEHEKSAQAKDAESKGSWLKRAAIGIGIVGAFFVLRELTRSR